MPSKEVRRGHALRARTATWFKGQEVSHNLFDQQEGMSSLLAERFQSECGSRYVRTRTIRPRGDMGVAEWMRTMADSDPWLAHLL